MPQHPFRPPRGRLTHLDIASEALAGNLLGDPSTRRVAVYLPAEYEASDAQFPLLVDLAAFTNSGLKRPAWKAFGESLPQRLDRLIDEGRMGPVVLAMPDAFTKLGGNQYVDTPALGNWATYLTTEMLPALERTYRILPGRRHRAVFGKSSGGYAALVHGMLYGEHWGAIACHSGDIGWEWGVRAGFPGLATRLGDFDGDPVAFLHSVWSSDTLRGSDFHHLMMLALAASYDPDPDAPYGIRLPIDPYTCEVDEVAWSRWLRHDPLEILERPGSAASLSALAGIYIDCGDQDEYHLQYGARRFVRRLAELGVEHSWHAFRGTHRSTDYRLDASLPFLYERIAPQEA